MEHQSPTKNIAEPRDLDTSPVFFTGLSNKAANSTKRCCKLCNINLFDYIASDMCTNCFLSNKVSQSNTSPSCSSNANVSSRSNNEIINSVLSSPILNTNSTSQNELIQSSIQTLLNTDIKALLTSVQSPKLENDNFKHKSTYKDRQMARSKGAPYIHPPQHSKQAASEPYPRTPISRNSRMHPYSVSPVPYASPSPKWSSPVHEHFVQLSRDMWQLFNQNKQSEDVKRKKLVLRDALQDVVSKIYPDCALYVVGSSMNGLGLRNSDIDMCLMLTLAEVDQKNEALAILKRIRNYFFHCKFIRNVVLIPAKVPILRFIDKVSGVEVDLNINNAIGIRNTQLISSYVRIDPRVAPLVITVKTWAKHYDINDASRNSLSSYSIVLMVLHYLQYRCQPPVIPCLQKLQPDKYLTNTDVRHLKLYEDLPPFISENKKDIGDLFVGFLNYFANEFNFNTVISVRLGLVLPKEQAKCNKSSPRNTPAQWKHVCIEEPFDLTNTARSVYADKVFNQIRAAFSDSWCHVMENPDLHYLLS
ncbi:hypothetical protein JTE90_019722 [Oedothorax gibbosus]|uniref:Poly(A) RNA polymerase GLD2 n=1 Tax=Oedothorax gibbosus TaxID=931172 RepID=A0AAV6UNX2_9ARAC|nr:hypothetical protein JTE90_019722 [Oedothorax gibbosus]